MDKATGFVCKFDHSKMNARFCHSCGAVIGAAGDEEVLRRIATRYALTIKSLNRRIAQTQDDYYISLGDQLETVQSRYKACMAGVDALRELDIAKREESS